MVEVIYEIAKSRGITKEQFDERREKKRQERGGFEKRIILDRVTKPKI